MLNELYELSQSLAHFGLLEATTNPNVSRVGKSVALVIALDKTGAPRALRLSSKEETALLWKHSKGNHNSFPAIKASKSLLSPAQSQRIEENAWQKAKLTEKLDKLLALDFTDYNTSSQSIKLSQWSWDELAPVLSSDWPELAALRQLLTIFPREGEQEAFARQLLLFIQKRLAACDDKALLDLVKDLLVGSLKKGTDQYSANCMMYYEVYNDGEAFGNLVGTAETQRALTALLNLGAADGSKGSGQIISPLSGASAEGVGAKYPNPNLPILGLTYLYSKKSDIPCLTRYNMTGAEAYQAGRQEVEAINNALAFLTAKQREKKSWCAVSDSFHDKPNLLLAYLVDDPQNDALLAIVLGNPEEDDLDQQSVIRESVFEKLCQQVLSSVEPVERKNSQSQVNLILLETLDPGRKQVVYETALTVEQLRRNLLRWQEAVQNYPPMEIKLWQKKGEKPISYQPQAFCPGPSTICQLLKLNYTRQGTAKPLKISALSAQEIYRLYMPQQDSAREETFLAEVLAVVVQKSARLLGDIAEQMHSNEPLKSSQQALAKQGAQFVALIAILLDLLEIRKEHYMQDAAYNVGQLLKLADLLHREYCIQVRNGGVPSQLMGNELLSITAENPIEGINRLRERMKIYQAWANTTYGENTKLAKWILKQLAEVSAKIAKAGLTDHFTPVEQAQVLLGYLAALPGEGKQQAKIIPDEDTLNKEENSYDRDH